LCYHPLHSVFNQTYEYVKDFKHYTSQETTRAVHKAVLDNPTYAQFNLHSGRQRNSHMCACMCVWNSLTPCSAYLYLGERRHGKVCACVCVLVMNCCFLLTHTLFPAVELVKLHNLGLETADEAYGLIPSLTRKIDRDHLQQLLDDIKRFQS
jgi:hypothetical protein